MTRSRTAVMVAALGTSLVACNSSIGNGSTGGGIHGNANAASSSASSTGSSATSGSSGGSTGSAPTATQASARCASLAGAVCGHDIACGSLDVSLHDTCVNALCANTALLQLADSEQDAGHTFFSSSALAACLADIADAGCSLSGALIQSDSANCQALGMGLEDVGGSCVIDADCQPSQVCMRTQVSCGGTCTSRLTSGACNVDTPPLAIGYFCASDGGVTPQQAPPSPCSASNQCLPPYVCVGLSYFGECNSIGSGGVGASCYGPNDCAIGFWCQSNGKSGTCTPLGAPGSPCVKVVGSGDAGVQKPDPTQCLELENCDPVMLTCQAEVAFGSNCNPDGGSPACAAGLCLNSDAGPTCSYLADDARCTSSAACASGACVFDGGRAYCGASCN